MRLVVRGYLPSNAEMRRGAMDMNMEQESLRELAQRKNNLLLELNNYAQNKRISVAGASSVAGVPSSRGMAGNNDLGIIPAQTQLSTSLAINLGSETRPVSTSFCEAAFFAIFSRRFHIKIKEFMIFLHLP